MKKRLSRKPALTTDMNPLLTKTDAFPETDKLPFQIRKPCALVGTANGACFVDGDKCKSLLLKQLPWFLLPRVAQQTSPSEGDVLAVKRSYLLPCCPRTPCMSGFTCIRFLFCRGFRTSKVSLHLTLLDFSRSARPHNNSASLSRCFRRLGVKQHNCPANAPRL